MMFLCGFVMGFGLKDCSILPRRNYIGDSG